MTGIQEALSATYDTAEQALNAAARIETKLKGAAHIFKTSDGFHVEDDGIAIPEAFPKDECRSLWSGDALAFKGDGSDSLWLTARLENSTAADWCDVDSAFDLLEVRTDEATIASYLVDTSPLVALMDWRGSRAWKWGIAA